MDQNVSKHFKRFSDKCQLSFQEYLIRKPVSLNNSISINFMTQDLSVSMLFYYNSLQLVYWNQVYESTKLLQLHISSIRAN